MSEKQTINDLLMDVAKLRKDNDYLSGELGYWKQQAQRNDSVPRGCDTDTREKLEADALALVDNLRTYGFKYAGDAEVEIIDMLDRQDAITTQECTDVYESGCEACRSAQKREIAELQERVDNLCASEEIGNELIMAQLETEAEQGRTIVEYAERVGALEAENARLREHAEKVWCDCDCCKWQEERENMQAKCDELQAELYAKQGALDIAVKNESNLEQRIIELEKDNDRLMQKVADAKVGAIGCPAYNPETHYCKWHCADFELNRSTLLKLRQDNYALRNERDELREKLSQALDHADSIGKLREI